MITFKDESACDHVAEARIQLLMILSGHHPTLIPVGFCSFCCVYKLEDGFRATLRKDKNCDDEVATTVKNRVYTMKHMVACSHASFSLHPHYVCIDSDKFIFSLPQFKGLSCFEIAPHGNTQDYGYSTKTLNIECCKKMKRTHR